MSHTILETNLLIHTCDGIAEAFHTYNHRHQLSDAYFWGTLIGKVYAANNPDFCLGSMHIACTDNPDDPLGQLRDFEKRLDEYIERSGRELLPFNFVRLVA